MAGRNLSPRPRHDLALAPTLCAGFESTGSPRDSLPQSVLAGRRNMREGGRQLGLPVPRRRFRRRDDRVHVVAEARPDRGEDVPAFGAIRRRAFAAGDQRGRPSGVRQRGRRVEAQWRTRPALPLPNSALSEQHHHRFIKKRIAASLGFRSAEGAWRTIEGYEAMHATTKVRSAGSRRAMPSLSASSSTQCSASLYSPHPAARRSSLSFSLFATQPRNPPRMPMRLV